MRSFRFAQKFSRIVRDTQGQNFISTLHRGQLDIIPWPVIQSEAFYSQMHVLQSQLKAKPVTHVNAATFLQTMKVLMARLKASFSYRAFFLKTLIVGRCFYYRRAIGEALMVRVIIASFQLLLMYAVFIASVAEGRVNILIELLPQALTKGFTGDSEEEGQLKARFPITSPSRGH